MFQSARLKLTFWYLIIIMLVSGFFSLIVYRGFTKELGRGFHMQSLRGTPQHRFVVQERNGFLRILPFVIYPEEVAPEEFYEIINLAKQRFALQLLIINGGILILAGTSGYFLAGKTLHPIEVMVDEQKRFVADASHELRTPLTSLKTEIEVALRDQRQKANDLRLTLKSNLAEVDKMKYFTDYLLSLSRYETNGTNLQMEKVELAEAVNQAIDRNKVQAKEKKIKIKQDISPVTVRGNAQSLVELISILVNNALKYSEKEKSISLSLRKQKKNAMIEVKDQGDGITQKDLPHIFDRFFRSEISRSKKDAEGFGLGLAIAKSIVELHKGEIKVKSVPSKGTTFTVILPA